MTGFLAKFEPNATESSLYDYFPGGRADKVSLDGAGNPYVTGILFGEALFGFGDNLHVLNSVGEDDQFITKYHKDPDAYGQGVVEWARTLLGSGLGSRSLIPGAEVAVTRLAYNSLTGGMHVAGDFSGTLTLDNLLLSTNNTTRHGFVAALCPTITLPASLPNYEQPQLHHQYWQRRLSNYQFACEPARRACGTSLQPIGGGLAVGQLQLHVERRITAGRDALQRRAALRLSDGERHVQLHGQGERREGVYR